MSLLDLILWANYYCFTIYNGNAISPNRFAIFIL